MVSNKAADHLLMQGSKASTAIVLPWFAQNNLGPQQHKG